jgi:hypothetical protein
VNAHYGFRQECMLSECIDSDLLRNEADLIRFCSRHRVSSHDARASLASVGAERSPHSAHFTTTSLLQRRGVIALITVGGGALGVVYFVHRLQTRERQTMRQAVYRDIEKLEKLKQAQNGAADK